MLAVAVAVAACGGRGGLRLTGRDGGQGAVGVPTGGAGGETASGLGGSGGGAGGSSGSSGSGGAGDGGSAGTAGIAGNQDGAHCLPLTIGTQPVAIASQQASPWAIATDGENVFWVNVGKNNSVGKMVGYPPWGDGQVVKYAIDGCDNSPSVLASGRAHFYDATPTSGLATDGTNVYWSDAGDALSVATGLSAQLLKCSVGGCENAPLAIGAFDAWAIAVNSNSIYWTTNDPNSSEGPVFTCPSVGCDSTPTALWSSGMSPGSGIALDANNVYWSTTFEVMKCPLGGCGGSPTVLVSSAAGLTNLGAIALDADNIYFIGTNYNDALSRILVCAKTGCADMPTTLATAIDPITPFVAIVTDGTSVYWTTSSSKSVTGQVYKCRVSGCAKTLEVIASGLNHPGGIAVDARNLYWTDLATSSDDGKIWAVAKN